MVQQQKELSWRDAKKEMNAGYSFTYLSKGSR